MTITHSVCVSCLTAILLLLSLLYSSRASAEPLTFIFSLVPEEALEITLAVII
jgi:hypothetical protein